MDYIASKANPTITYQPVHDDLGERPLLSRSKSDSRTIASTIYDGDGYPDSKHVDTKTAGVTVELTPITITGSQRGEHDLFCEIIGKSPSTTYFSPSSAGGPNNALINSPSLNPRALYPRVLRAYHQQRIKYRILSLSTTVVLWLQLIDGAACAGLGSTKDMNTGVVVIILGSLQAVFAGLLAWFNARDQPERSRQYRNGLKRVLDAIDDTEADFRLPGYSEGVQTVREKVQSIQDMYKEIEKDMSAAATPSAPRGS